VEVAKPRTPVADNSDPDLNFGFTLPFDDSEAGKLFTSTDPNSEMRGGIRIFYGRKGPANMSYDVRLPGFPVFTGQYWTSGLSNNTRPVIHSILVWPTEVFGPAFTGKTARFGNTAATAEFFLNVTSVVSGNLSEWRFLVREGMQYYLSEQSYSGLGAFTFSGFQNNDAVGKRWAPFNPATAGFEPIPANVVYAAKDFQNITAVGLWARTSRTTTGGANFGFSSFTVKAETVPPVLSWQRTNFGSETSPNAGLTDNPDHDEFVNLWEYFLDQDPMVFNPSKSLIQSFHFPRSPHDKATSTSTPVFESNVCAIYF
jgi:hypothetical protein